MVNSKQDKIEKREIVFFQFRLIQHLWFHINSLIISDVLISQTWSDFLIRNLSYSPSNASRQVISSTYKGLHSFGFYPMAVENE